MSMRSTDAKPYRVGPDDGEALGLLGGLYVWKALGAQTGGAYSLCEVTGPEGFAIPLHAHDREQEGFYVASGPVTLVLDDQQVELPAGGFGLAPPDLPHAFRLEAPGSRLLLLTPGAAGHEALFAELGEPATSRTLPPPPQGPPDAERLAAIAASHGTRILGPPPGAG